MTLEVPASQAIYFTENMLKAESVMHIAGPVNFDGAADEQKTLLAFLRAAFAALKADGELELTLALKQEANASSMESFAKLMGFA